MQAKWAGGSLPDAEGSMRHNRCYDTQKSSFGGKYWSGYISWLCTSSH
uniref:Uncharacterized protein n=1 Tax=Arundo donax TaxID=35708 RepID=A0A0A9D080_ARUDO